MSGVNRFIGVGRLGQEPTSGKTGEDKTWCNFSLALPWGKDQTVWMKVKVYGTVADACAKHLNKGSMVYVEGELNPEEWVDKAGLKRTDKTIFARSVQFLSDWGALKAPDNDQKLDF